jgi:integrase
MARNGNIKSYQANGKTWWRISVRVRTPSGSMQVREKRIATQEQAKIRLAAILHDAYEGRAFSVRRSSQWTVADALEYYRPYAEGNTKSAETDAHRSVHLLQHLGTRHCEELNRGDVDHYRAVRRTEKTRRGETPSPATLDRELELLKRVINYSVDCKKLTSNPIAKVAFLRVPNVRKVVLTPEEFQAGLAKLKPQCAWMREPLTLSFETGMRISEVLHLERKRIDWKTGRFELTPDETKGEDSRIVYLSKSLLEALKALPVRLDSPWVFANPKTGKARARPKATFKKAFGSHVNIHDLRRSFATYAIQVAGLPESLVLAMGGWTTPAMLIRYNIVKETNLAEAARRLEAARAASLEASGASGAR